MFIMYDTVTSSKLQEPHFAVTKKSTCLSKSTILCWVSFTAILDYMRHTVDMPGISLLNHCVAVGVGCSLTSLSPKSLTLQKDAPEILLKVLGAESGSRSSLSSWFKPCPKSLLTYQFKQGI